MNPIRIGAEGNPLQSLISVCKIKVGKKMTIQRNVTVAATLEEIRSGRYAAEIDRVRTLVAKYGKDSNEVKAAKRVLPAYLFSGRIDGQVAKAMEEGRFHHSGLLQLDFDDIKDPEAFRGELFKDPHVIAAWLSPSGEGVKGLAAMEAATSEEAHKRAFAVAESHFATRGWTLDKACKNSNRLCFAGWDPEIKIREDEPEVFTAKGLSVTHTPTPLSEVSEESVSSAESISSAESVRSVASAASVPSIASIAQHSQGSIGDKIRASELARAKLKSDTRIYGLYQKHVEKRFTPAHGKRNSDLIEMVTFLFHAVGTETLMALVAAFYDLNQDIFPDSREQHMAEAVAHLKSCNESWFNDLSPEQREYASDLPESYQEAFRICRDLAILEDECHEPGKFFLSYRQLSNRIGISDKSARRILLTFESQGWLKPHVKGTQHKPGSIGKATVYLWLLPLAIAILILSMPRIFYNCPLQPIWLLIAS